MSRLTKQAIDKGEAYENKPKWIMMALSGGNWRTRNLSEPNCFRIAKLVITLKLIWLYAESQASLLLIWQRKKQFSKLFDFFIYSEANLSFELSFHSHSAWCCEIQANSIEGLMSWVPFRWKQQCCSNLKANIPKCSSRLSFWNAAVRTKPHISKSAHIFERKCRSKYFCWTN